jgi:hypothetical protein
MRIRFPNLGGKMRRFYTTLFAGVLVIMLPVSVYAQGFGFNASYLEFSALGGGARAAGMGGAYLGVGEGEMAYSWNPAALMTTDRAKFGFQVASIADKFNSFFIHQNYLYPEPNIGPYESNREHVSLNYGGFALPFEFLEREWAVGGGYRNVFDMIREFEAPGFDGSRNIYTQDRGIDAASAAIAGSVIQGLSLGITGNIYLRNSETNYYLGRWFEFVAQNEIDTIVVDFWENTNSHYTGFNVDVGAFYDLGIVRGGFVFHSPYKLVQDIRFKQAILIQPDYFGAIDRLTQKYNMPAAYSAGLALVPMEKLILAADFSMRKLSEVDVEMNWEQIIYTDTTYSAEWEDINQFRVGAEYLLDAGFGDIPIRFGFRNEPLSVKEVTAVTFDDTDSTWTDQLGDQVSTNIFAFGTGLHLEKIWFDLAYQFGSNSYNSTVTYTTPQTIEMKRDYSRLVFSAGMYF